MARNGHAAAGLLIVLALFGLAAWFVFMPAEPAPLTVAEDEAAAEVEGAEAEGATPDALPTQTPSHAVEPSESTTPEREELASVPEGAIVVRAVDPAGVAVADLVIAVGMQIPGQRSAIRFGSGRTDAEGRAVVFLDHARRKRVAPFPPNPELLIDARFASTEKVRVKRLLEAAEAEETVLQLPEVRRVEILVTLLDGGRVDFPVRVSAEWTSARVPEDQRDWSQRRPEELPVEGDRAVLVCGVDMQLRLSAWDSTGRYGSGWSTEPGPTAADPPVVERELPLGILLPRIRARLVNEQGEPWANAHFSLYTTQTRRPTEEAPEAGKPETRWNSTFDTDAEGRFDFSYFVNEYTQRHDRSWSFVLSSTDRAVSLPRIDEEGAVQGSLALPLAMQPGEVLDAGDVVVQPLDLPLLVSGRVVNREGKRAPAVVSVSTPEADWRKRTRLWQGQPERDGSFTVRAPMPPGETLIVEAGGFGHLGVQQTVPIGTQGLELLMVKGITLRGRLILPDGMPFHEMEIRMPGGRAKEVFPGGTFAVDYLRPAADSWVSLEHNGRELWRSGPILIEGEGDNDFRPAQVQEVDLRGTMRAWRMAVRNPDGSLVEEHSSVTCHAGEAGRNFVRIDALSTFSQVLPIGVDRIHLVRRGFEPVEVRWPPPAEIRFTPAEG